MKFPRISDTPSYGKEYIYLAFLSCPFKIPIAIALSMNAKI